MLKSTTIVTAALLAGLSTASFAAEFGTADEAKAMLAKAIAQIASAGPEAAFKAFNDPKGGFVDRDLYVACFDMQGTMKAHGANQALIGKSLLNIKDGNGKLFVQEMVQIASTTGEGTIDFTWANPLTKKIEPKVGFLKKAAGDVACTVGIYKS